MEINLLRIMSSFYCKIVFLFSLVISYYLLPDNVFSGVHGYIAIIFMLSFSFSIACIARNIRNRIVLARTYKTSVLSIILYVLGFSAFQVCGINAAVCSATVGAGVVSAIFPSFFVGFLTEYGHIIIWISVIFQLITLHYMRCFKSDFSRSHKNAH